MALLAGFMRGFVGVGSGMLMAPVFAILFGPLQTVETVIMLDAFVTAQLLPSVHRLVEWLGAKYFYNSTDRRYRQVALGLLLCVAVYGILR